MSAADGTIGWLTDPGTADASRSGGKGASLAALVAAGLPVPTGFVVSTDAYRDFVREHHLDVTINNEMAQMGDGPGAVDAASERLRGAFEAAAIPAWLDAAIAAAYSALGEGPVAVRSSATAEDLPEASFAGQQETVLNVVGAEDLCDAVRRCWSSLWTARAIAYRRRQDIACGRIAVAVVVQRMVPADVAGVLFTVDPMSGRRDHVVIEAAAGLGEAVVSGRVTPDRWTIDAHTHAVLSGPGRAAQPVLTPGQLEALVGLGSRAADVFGTPQDIEWAVAEGRCWLLQSRPITSLFPLPPASDQPGLRVYIPVMLVAQGVTEPFTPAGNVFFRAMAAAWIRYLTTGSRRADNEAPPWLPVVAGRIFLDATPLLQRPRVAAKLFSSLRMKDPAASAALREWVAGNSGRLPRPRGWSAMRGLAPLIPQVLSGLVASVMAPNRTRWRLLRAADDRLARLQQQAAGLSSPLEQLDFVYRILPARTCDVIVEQLAAVYAEEILKVVAERLIARWLGSSSGFEPVRRWLPHDPTMAMGAELARLARDHARAGTEPCATSPEVAKFLAAYGHRAPDREIDLGLPRLADDPTYVVELIGGYLKSDDPGQSLERFRAGAAEAETAVAELVADVHRAKGRLAAAALRGLLYRYRQLGGMRERPKFDMVRGIALGRRTLQRVGASLVEQGLLTDVDDVYFLDTADVRAALTDQAQDVRAIAAANRREFERELGRRSVPRILVSDGETVYGPTSRPVAETADVLVGTPVSPGTHEGMVRVLDSPVRAELCPGEVLVAASTDPGWTPMFLLAGALVMEVGGVVSHGAVVAREYGIPAVAGIADATRRLRTGQRVRVDGESGTVTLLEQAGDEPVVGSQETVSA
jgi:rifampicin phosphotransferase